MDEITKEDDRLSSPAETQAEVEAYHTLSALSKYRAAGRGGFTLIELLIVLVVVLLLAGLLLGAVLVVRQRVRVAQQVAELVQLDLALNNFKQKYGIFPPSRIRLREWDFRSGTDGTPYLQNDPFDQHSVAYLRRIWPSIKLWVSSGGPTPTIVETPDPGSIGQWFQDNSANAVFTPRVYELEGDECLVFFLGGICEKTGQDKYILHGFTDDASNPSRIPNGAIARTQKRTQPMYPFDVGRLYQRGVVPPTPVGLVQQQEAGTREAEFGLGEFFGPQPAQQVGQAPGLLPSYKIVGADQSRPLPVAYFSAYEGRGYRPDDINIPGSLDSSIPPTGDFFRIDPITNRPISDQFQFFQLTWAQVTGGPNSTIRKSPRSLGPNPYCRNGANPALRQGYQPGPPEVVSRIQPYNPQTFQLILPGPDNEFGAGGSQVDYDVYRGSPTDNWLSNEDNITNFSGGAAIGDFVNQQTQK